ncbi:MAG: S8 family serine peptidase [Pseudomonadota bacterium]
MKKNQSGFISILITCLFFSGGCGLKPKALSSGSETSNQLGLFQTGVRMDSHQLNQRIEDYGLLIKSFSEDDSDLEHFTAASGISLGTHGVIHSHIVVKFRDPKAETTVRKALSVLPQSLYQFKSSGAKLIPIPNSSDEKDILAHIAALRELAGVEYAYPDYQVAILAEAPDDTFFEKQYGLNNTGQVANKSSGFIDADIDAPEAWEITTGSRNVTVAVIDSGVDYNHPDLVNNIWLNPGETGTDSAGADKSSNGIDDDGNGYIDDFRGWDFVDNDNDPMDTNGHGTHVAGIIGARGNNSRGVTGINWQVSIVPLRTMDSTGMGSNSNIKKAVEYATAMHFHITNNSYAGGDFDQSMKDSIEAAKAAGVLFVAAAGNEGSNNDTSPVYPANYDVDNLVTVGASNNTDTLAFFSNYGVNKVHLVAPGENILSTYLNGTYSYLSGTSMAAPHVAGAAALLKAKDSTLTYSAIKSALINTVDTSSLLQTKTRSGGRLNLARALGGSPTNNGITPDLNPLLLSKIAGPLAGGTTLTIFGSGFQTGVKVAIGNRSCSNALVDKPLGETDLALAEQAFAAQGLTVQVPTEKITCTLPSHRAGTYFVKVVNPDGRSTYLSSYYRYRGAPKLNSISPNRTSVASVSAGKIITLNGTGFVSGATVKINGSNCSPLVVDSSEQIFCVLPNSLTAGDYPVIVTNPEGQSSSSLSIKIENITSGWVRTQGGVCSAVCKQEGLESKASPEGAMCASGKIIPASAVGTIAFTYGCFPNTSCVAQGPVSGAVSSGKYCYSTSDIRKYQASDITMGCYCGL